jgi:hypothetical protein
VNGPKDQAGGCLTGLLFCLINILISVIQNFDRKFFLENLDQFGPEKKIGDNYGVFVRWEFK